MDFQQTEINTSSNLQFWKPDPNTKLLMFQKDGKTACLDVVDGKMEYTGDLPVAESAQLLFDWLADNISDLLIAKFGRQAIERAIQ